LYTIVVRSQRTGKGVPLAWMVTNSNAQYPPRFWLEWLKEEHNFQPKSVMIDNCDAEIKAINCAYNEGDSDSPKTNILICQWHLFKAWKHNIAKKVYSLNGEKGVRGEVSGKHTEAFQVMLAMVSASTPDDFEVAQDNFSLWCEAVEEEGWDATELYLYFQSDYYNKKTLWSNAFGRQVNKINIFYLL
jgi:hypothetical protein